MQRRSSIARRLRLARQRGPSQAHPTRLSEEALASGRLALIALITAIPAVVGGLTTTVEGVVVGLLASAIMAPAVHRLPDPVASRRAARAARDEAKRMHDVGVAWDRRQQKRLDE